MFNCESLPSKVTSIMPGRLSGQTPLSGCTGPLMSEPQVANYADCY